LRRAGVACFTAGNRSFFLKALLKGYPMVFPAAPFPLGIAISFQVASYKLVAANESNIMARTGLMLILSVVRS
jgi:hypothetical protein